ncbi:flagellar motor switch protein FliN/FliY [Arboricoccus pini]|uniref:Flagellar motor switch protein FliN n=1 Tax=Arboricoccus pini TaxID=1963835 RepID=A0A212RBH8_9PROT|nr:flagellar motor switch protein FliN [Arboricoccus pini]SNB69572.1 flagellar motor switch protein FliN/FliY [Arboricoccus pini]
MLDLKELSDGEQPTPEEVHEGHAVDRLKAVYDVPVQVSAVLGRAHLPVGQLLKLGRGAVVELDRKVGEPVEIFVNNKLIARGEIIIVAERLGITMTEIVKGE